AGVDFLMKKNKVTVIKGNAKLVGKLKIDVALEAGGTQSVSAKNIILAMGSVPKSLPNVVVDHKRLLNSHSILELPKIPKSLIVVGAGAVGAEFASIFNHVGSQVTLIEFMPRVLPIEDDESSKELEKHFRRRKIEVLTNTKLEKVEITETGVKAL